MTKIILSRSKRITAAKESTEVSKPALINPVINTPFILPLPTGLKCDTSLNAGTWEDHLNEAPIFDYSNNSVTFKFKVDGKIDGEPYLKKDDKSYWIGLKCSVILIHEVVVGDIKYCNDFDKPYNNDKEGFYDDTNKKIDVDFLSPQIQQPPSTSLPEIEQKQQRLTFTFTSDQLSILKNKTFKLLVIFALEYRNTRGVYHFYYP